MRAIVKDHCLYSELTDASILNRFASLLRCYDDSRFFVVLMTRNLSQQVNFYQNILGFELIFDNQDTIGLGKNKKLFVVLREDKSNDSHHLSHHKGPQIHTFKSQGHIEDYILKITQSGFKLRDTVKLREHKTQYIFIEDYDANEICLDFPLEIPK